MKKLIFILLITTLITPMLFSKNTYITWVDIPDFSQEIENEEEFLAAYSLARITGRLSPVFVQGGRSGMLYFPYVEPLFSLSPEAYAFAMAGKRRLTLGNLFFVIGLGFLGYGLGSSLYSGSFNSASITGMFTIIGGCVVVPGFLLIRASFQEFDKAVAEYNAYLKRMVTAGK